MSALCEGHVAAAGGSPLEKQITTCTGSGALVVSPAAGRASGAVSQAEAAVLRAEVVRLCCVVGKWSALHPRKHQELQGRLRAVEHLLLLELRDIGHGFWVQDPLCQPPAGCNPLVARAGLALVAEVPSVVCRIAFACNAEATVASPALEAA